MRPGHVLPVLVSPDRCVHLVASNTVPCGDSRTNVPLLLACKKETRWIDPRDAGSVICIFLEGGVLSVCGVCRV